MRNAYNASSRRALKGAFIGLSLFCLAACAQTSHTPQSQASVPPSGQAAQSGDAVRFTPYGDPGDFPWTVVAYSKSLGTDQVIQFSPPQEYGPKLAAAVQDHDTGVELYEGPPLKFRIVEVSGVEAGTQARLMVAGKFAGTVPFVAGTTFEIRGNPPTAFFVVDRAAWRGPDPVVCYELLPGQGYHLTELPLPVKGKYKGRTNLDCTPAGDIDRILGNPHFNRVRMNAIVDRDERLSPAPPAS